MLLTILHHMACTRGQFVLKEWKMVNGMGQLENGRVKQDLKRTKTYLLLDSSQFQSINSKHTDA